MDLEVISIWMVDKIVRVEENPPMGRGDPQECKDPKQRVEEVF